MIRLSRQPWLAAIDALFGRIHLLIRFTSSHWFYGPLSTKKEVLPSKRVRGDVQPVVGTLATQKPRTFELIDRTCDRLTL